MNKISRKTRAICAAIAVASPFVIASAMAGPGKDGHSHHHADERAFGEPGDPTKPAREIVITMTEGDGTMSFEPNMIDVKKGEQIRFKLKNAGELEHEIVIATREENLEHAKEMAKNPDMEHDDPNARRLKPGSSDEIVWSFSKSGEFDMSCLIPGHLEAGMTGTIVVK